MKISNIYYFLQGYGRYILVKCFGFSILRCHIVEQIVSRVMSSRGDCVDSGRCILCGCHTPALFYANKACDGECYPKMMGRGEWEEFVKMGGNDDWNYIDNKFYRVKEVIDEGIL